MGLLNKMNKITIVSLFLFFSILFLLSGVSATDVSTCSTISSSGVYNLINNLNCTGDGIIINANDTIFNCQGNTINYSLNGGANERGIEVGVSGKLHNVTVKNCKIEQTNHATTANYRQGMIIYDSTNITIFNNTIHTYAGSSQGIDMWGTSQTTAKNNNISSNTITTEGIDQVQCMKVADDSYLATVENNILTCTGSGIFTWDGADSLTISSNNITSSEDCGLDIRYSDNSVFSNNNIMNSLCGVYIDSASLNNQFIDNDVNATNYAVFINSGCNNYTLQNNIIRSSGADGSYNVRIDSIDNLLIGNNFTEDGSADNVFLNTGSEVNVSSNTFYGGDASLYLFGGGHWIYNNNMTDHLESYGSNSILNNNISLDDVAGVSYALYNSGSYTNITDNSISTSTSTTWGIFIITGDFVNITGNTIDSNTVSSESVRIKDTSTNNTFEYNTIESNGTGISVDSDYNIIKHNVINSIGTGDMYYGMVFAGSFAVTGNLVQNNTITSSDSYALIINDNNHNNNFYDNNITRTSVGTAVLFDNTAQNNTMENNTISSQSDALWFDPDTDGNIIKGNNITSVESGIYVTNGVLNLTIQRNRFNSTAGEGIMISASSSNHLIEYNTINSYDEGIYIYSWSENPIIQHNTITSTNKRGINLLDENDNAIIYNNTITTSIEDGISIFDTTNTNISLNTIVSGRNGIYVEQGSLNLVDNNDITSSYSGILLEASNNNNITNGKINTTDNSANDAGIKLKSSLRNRIENMDIYVSITPGEGIYLLDTSEGNIILNTTITFDPTIYGFGIFFNSDNNNATNVRITKTFASAFTYLSSDYCILFRDANGNVVSDSVLNCTNSVDIAVRGATAEKNYVVNTTFNSSETVWHSTETSEILSVQWYLDAQVNDTLGSPIGNATISIYSLTGTLEKVQNTSVNGSASRLRMTEYEQNATTKNFLTPTTVNVTSSLYYTNSTSFNLTSLHNVDYDFTLSLDTTPPNVSIDNITTSSGSRNFDFNATMSDTKPMTCKYSIFDSNGTIDGSNENVSFTCNSNPVSATTSVFGTFNLTVYSKDSAGNENSDSESFTTSVVVTPGGGGGSTIEEIEKIPTIALKQIDSTVLYSELERAVFYARINTYCSVKQTEQTLAIQDFSGECSLKKSDMETITGILYSEGFTVTLNDMILFYEKFNGAEFEQTYQTLDIIKTYDLFTSVLGITNEMLINPPRLDRPFVISGDENVTIEYIFTVNKEVRDCSIISGEGFSCELITNNSVKMILTINDTKFFDKIFQGEMSITSQADPQNLEVKRIALIPRVYNLSYPIAGIPAIWVLVIIVVVILIFSVFFVARSRFKKKLKRNR